MAPSGAWRGHHVIADPTVVTDFIGPSVRVELAGRTLLAVVLVVLILVVATATADAVRPTSRDVPS